MSRIAQSSSFEASRLGLRGLLTQLSYGAFREFTEALGFTINSQSSQVPKVNNIVDISTS